VGWSLRDPGEGYERSLRRTELRFVGLRYEPDGVSGLRDKRPVSFNPSGSGEIGGFMLVRYGTASPHYRIRVFVYLIDCWENRLNKVSTSYDVEFEHITDVSMYFFRFDACAQSV
jgi:hypothetical protein